MALLKSCEKQVKGFGDVILDNGYCKVTNIIGSKEQIKFTLTVVNKKSNVIFKESIYKFIPSMDGGNFIKQAYAHLKTLPEFSGAVDC